MLTDIVTGVKEDLDDPAYQRVENGWTQAELVELPGVITAAPSREEAQEMLLDALREFLLECRPVLQRIPLTDSRQRSPDQRHEGDLTSAHAGVASGVGAECRSGLTAEVSEPE